MNRSFGKRVALVGVSCAAGLLIQTMAAASPSPAGIALEQATTITTAQDQIRKRDLKKDGSCQVSQDQIRKRDQKKDGSCAS